MPSSCLASTSCRRRTFAGGVLSSVREQVLLPVLVLHEAAGFRAA